MSTDFMCETWHGLAVIYSSLRDEILVIKTDKIISLRLRALEVLPITHRFFYESYNEIWLATDDPPKCQRVLRSSYLLRNTHQGNNNGSEFSGILSSFSFVCKCFNHKEKCHLQQGKLVSEGFLHCQIKFRSSQFSKKIAQMWMTVCWIKVDLREVRASWHSTHQNIICAKRDGVFSFSFTEEM